MNDDLDPNHEPDGHGGQGNDGGAITPAGGGGALTSLKALELALSGVDVAAIAGRSGLPLMQFRSRENGTWSFGQQRTIPEKDSCWAPNPTTYMWGYICFDKANKPAGEHLVPVSKPKPDITELPDKGFPWQEQWGVSMKCLDGADAGIEVVFKSTTVGGIQAIAGSATAVRDRIRGGQHNNKVVPIVHLEKDSYPHPEHGRIWVPVLKIVDWMPLSGPAPAPASPPSPPPAEQPRRRRVA